MSVLITGGAGYIGTAIVETMRDAIVIDNLSTGKTILDGVTYYIEDYGNEAVLNEIINTHDITACIHLAGSSLVSESEENPIKYLENNVINTVHLLNALVRNKVKYIVFSSSCAVYGEPKFVPITEDHPTEPKNVYGTTKLLIEMLLDMYDKSYGLKYVSLRYFNAAGHTIFSQEKHSPESHIIPLLMSGNEVTIYGTDYDTPDGTAIRDYIHIYDLATAHRDSLALITDTEQSHIINLGNGKGYSVKEVVDTVGQQFTVNVVEGPRRKGDPEILIADNTKAKELLNWSPKYDSLESIINTMW